MPTEILAINTTAANSADQVVTSSGLTVCLKDAAGPKLAANCVVNILLKDDAGQYFRVDQLSTQKPAVFISAAGTYRFSRPVGPSCGVFSG